MRLTEEEARTRRCQEAYPASNGVTDSPYVRSISMPAPSWYDVGSAVAVQTATAPLHCIASHCMAWRWCNNWTTIDGQPLGFCGKAGNL